MKKDFQIDIKKKKWSQGFNSFKKLAEAFEHDSSVSTLKNEESVPRDTVREVSFNKPQTNVEKVHDKNS